MVPEPASRKSQVEKTRNLKEIKLVTRDSLVDGSHAVGVPVAEHLVKRGHLLELERLQLIKPVHSVSLQSS